MRNVIEEDRPVDQARETDPAVGLDPVAEDARTCIARALCRRCGHGKMRLRPGSGDVNGFALRERFRRTIDRPNQQLSQPIVVGTTYVRACLGERMQLRCRKFHGVSLSSLGSGLIGQSQKMTAAAMQMADIKV